MNLQMDPTCATGLKSGSQIARRITESWAEHNLFCVSCNSECIEPLPVNSPAIDFNCLQCASVYQLKAGRSWNERKVPDAGYEAMMKSLRSDMVPNLLVMQYTGNWFVHNLLVVPSFFFTPAAVEKRKPLGPNARRAGWVGCNILLTNIAEVGKIRLVSDGTPEPANNIRQNFKRVHQFADLQRSARGWALDVLRLLKQLRKSEFTINDAYSMEKTLAAIYPNNRNVRPKIRQQLQVLRDLGWIRFLDRGCYKLLK